MRTPIFAAHTAIGGILMFNAGFAQGEAVGSYRGDPLYHTSSIPLNMRLYWVASVLN